MFLSQKNAVYFNKPKQGSSRPRRVLPGWEDEAPEDSKDRYEFKAEVPEERTGNLLEGDEVADLTAEPPRRDQKYYLDWDTLNEKDDIECEKRLVEDIVAPGGIRVKPNEALLAEFLKEVKGMEVHVVGSLLLSKLEVNYPFQTKAKALYTLEYLAKKNDVFLSYFKAHAHLLSTFPEPEDNVDNYRKILKTLLNFIGLPPAPAPAQEKLTFVDPGYNDDPRSQMTSFLQENTATVKPKTGSKKAIVGPGMKPRGPEAKAEPKVELNQNQNQEFLSLDLLGSPAAKPQQPPAHSFEDMLGGLNLNSNGKNLGSNPGNNSNLI